MPGPTPQDDGSSHDEPARRNGHDAALPEPRPGGRARLPARGAAGAGPRPPARARAPTAPPPPLSATEVSSPHDTIPVVPRWDDAPLVGRAEELARLLAH